jgi:hypothetical protein
MAMLQKSLHGHGLLSAEQAELGFEEQVSLH